MTMRKATYDLRKVVCRNASCIGYSSNIAKPGYWITWNGGNSTGRVLGRIAESDHFPGKGYLAVIQLHAANKHAGIQWVNPDDVVCCYEKPPAKLLAWLCGEDWVKNKDDIARIIAMSHHGTLSEEYIDNEPIKKVVGISSPQETSTNGR